MQRFATRSGLFRYTALILAILMAIAFLSSCSRGAKGNDSSSAESSSPASKSSIVKDVELSPTTEYLEYSAKDIDPTTIVSASDSEVNVTTDDKIDLLKVGVQVIEYELSDGDDSDNRKIQFVVRDTKAPAIELSSSDFSIDQGESFNPHSCISSVSDPVDGDLILVDSEPEAQGADVGLEQFYDNGWFIVDGTVDANTPGTYSLMVKASDKHGNIATKELLVTVNEIVQETQAPASTEQTHTYILNTKSHKFHIAGCRDISKMKDSNKAEITATRQEVIDMGYTPCGHCNP